MAVTRAVAAGVAFMCLCVFAQSAWAKPPKLSATVSSAGLEVDATGTVGRGGPAKPPRKRWKVRLEERAGGAWVQRATGKLSGPKLNRFALGWTAPEPGEVKLRVRVKAGTKTVATSPPSNLVLDDGSEPKVDVVETSAVTKLPTADDQTLVLSGEHNFTPGQFLSTAPGAGAPDGFLLRVISSTVSAGQTTVSTEPASLYDAVPNGSIDMSLGDLGSATPLNGAARKFSDAMSASGNSQNVPFSEQVSCSGSASLTLDGALDADLGPNFELNWSRRFGFPTGIDSAQATIDATLSAQAEAAISGAANCEMSPITLIAPRWVVIAVVGGVPVPITIEIPIKLRASGEVSGSASVNASANADGSVGIRYEDGDVSGIRELNRTANADFNVDANGHLEARIGPDIEVTAGWRIPVLGSLAAEAGLDVTTGLVADYASAEAPPGNLCIPFTAIGDLEFHLPIVGEIETGDIELFNRNIRCWQFPTTTSERARITWNTGADIDLHIYDDESNHAWYGDNFGIPDAELSADDTNGFGPEVFTDGLSPSTRSFSYAIHYFGPGDTESGPPTNVTLTITHPNGSEVTTQHLLNVDDFINVGSSPRQAFDQPIAPPRLREKEAAP